MRNSVIFTVMILMLSAIMVKTSYCDYDYANEELRISEGQVVAVDVNGSVLTVKGIDTIDFPISSDTKLAKDIYDIKLSDISVGNYVKVEYRRDPRGLSRIPYKVIKVTVEYGKGEE